MGIALARLAAEDPSFRVETDLRSGQTIMKGMGELHLDISWTVCVASSKLRRISMHRVTYRETSRAKRRSTTRRNSPVVP